MIRGKAYVICVRDSRHPDHRAFLRSHRTLVGEMMIELHT